MHGVLRYFRNESSAENSSYEVIADTFWDDGDEVINFVFITF